MADKVENWTCEQLGKLGIDATIDIARLKTLEKHHFIFFLHMVTFLSRFYLM